MAIGDRTDPGLGGGGTPGGRPTGGGGSSGPTPWGGASAAGYTGYGAQLVGGGNDYWSNYFQNHGLAPLPTYDTSAADAARQQQMQVIQQLQSLAAGDMNSQAQQNLRASYDQSQQAQSALGSSQRGVGAGAQMQQVQQSQGMLQTSLAGQQELLKQQQMLAAQQMLAQQLGNVQGMDLSQAQAQSQAALQGSALQAAMEQFLAGQGAQYQLGQADIRNQANNAAFNQGVIGGQYANQAGGMLAGAAGGTMAMLGQFGNTSPAAGLTLPYNTPSQWTNYGGSSTGDWNPWSPTGKINGGEP